MARSIRLFVTCSPDLAAEREMLGRLIAGLPVSVGWDVAYTPLPGEDANAGIVSVRDSDFFLALLGHDFAAPMGSEWAEAVRFGRVPLAYRKNVPNSPSAAMHLRNSKIKWEEFNDPDDLRRRLLPRLAQALLDRQEVFGLQLPEVEGLLGLVKASGTETEGEEERTRTGAGRGGIILGRGNL